MTHCGAAVALQVTGPELLKANLSTEIFCLYKIFEYLTGHSTPALFWHCRDTSSSSAMSLSFSELRNCYPIFVLKLYKLDLQRDLDQCLVVDVSSFQICSPVSHQQFHHRFLVGSNCNQ